MENTKNLLIKVLQQCIDKYGPINKIYTLTNSTESERINIRKLANKYNLPINTEIKEEEEIIIQKKEDNDNSIKQEENNNEDNKEINKEHNEDNTINNDTENEKEENEENEERERSREKYNNKRYWRNDYDSRNRNYRDRDFHRRGGGRGRFNQYKRFRGERRSYWK